MRCCNSTTRSSDEEETSVRLRRMLWQERRHDQTNKEPQSPQRLIEVKSVQRMALRLVGCLHFKVSLLPGQRLVLSCEFRSHVGLESIVTVQRLLQGSLKPVVAGWRMAKQAKIKAIMV